MQALLGSRTMPTSDALSRVGVRTTARLLRTSARGFCPRGNARSSLLPPGPAGRGKSGIQGESLPAPRQRTPAMARPAPSPERGPRGTGGSRAVPCPSCPHHACAARVR